MTKIEWCDEVWNPVTGCTKIREGCKNCYAERIAKRFWGDRNFTDVQCHPDRLKKPLHWKKPRKIFVCSMSDLFHEDVPENFIDKVFALMALNPLHTFIVLTKRPKRMLEYLSYYKRPFFIAREIDKISVQLLMHNIKEEIKPIPNYPGYFISNYGVVYTAKGSRKCEVCGVDIEGSALKKYCSHKCNLRAFRERKKGIRKKETSNISPMSPDVGKQGHILLPIQASKRIVSVEPQLESINLEPYLMTTEYVTYYSHNLGIPREYVTALPSEEIDWILCGCESGQNRRQVNINSIRNLRDQCIEWNVPFFLKQMEINGKVIHMPELDGRIYSEFPK